jgi:predicted AlkP superfamily pyrophosphatase or phosphodiesterase
VEPLDPVRPAYGSASLAEVMPSVLAVLGVPEMTDPLVLAERLDGVRRVVLLLVDGLGHHLLPVAAPVAPLLADAVAGRLGWLRPLTTAFPSTTPTGLTTLGTGAPPGAHGVVGFTVRVPGTGRILTHINWNADPDPMSWQPVPTRFGQAAAAGVAVTVVGRAAFAGTGLTVAAYRGASYRPADGPDALAAGMLAALRQSDPPALVYGYHADVDTAGHLYGVDSDPWRVAAADLDRLLDRLLAGLPGDSALLVTADHGQVDIPASQRFDLDADPRLRAGLAAVAGEPRVRYLHTAPGAAGDVLATWREVLGDAAMVASREQAIAEGWFGPVTVAHQQRIGDVVVTCQDRYAVLASAHEPDRVSTLVAFHGSCTAAEMLVPLWVVRP